jgi:7,8-dihydropterin-6-yl-methyl-4-(beta-D-ribofuranosyl)aminobenzene 5'-phosphate synthase
MKGTTTMKITVLSENTTTCPEIECEHGLSLYMEVNDQKILFDMGQSDLLVRNAERLGVDLAAVDIAVLSHGHYDHGGGIGAFRGVNEKAPLYISRHAFGAFYSDKYIGLADGVREEHRLIMTDGVLCLGQGITLYADGTVPLFAEQNRGLTKDEDGVRIPDDFCHEQYLLVKEGDKRILFSGCSHKGIVNIVRHFRPDVLVGGFHFKNLDPQGDAAFLQSAAEALRQSGAVFYTCHCTGKEQYDFLKKIMGDRLYGLSAGQTVII